VFSLWDTYRALHPLLTIIDTKRTNDFINTFLCQYQQGGRLPVWELSSNETDCMIGYHSVSVIWDAYNKGIRGFDANLAFEAMKHSAMEDRNGLKFYKAKGYISSEDDNESVSKTLEYAYDDWCIAQMAKALGKTDDYNYFEKRRQNWKNLFNPETGFFQAKKNGSWIKNFDPYEVNSNYTEANAWQYSVSVPHDLETLNSLYRGKNELEYHLDILFKAEEKTNGRIQADISGLIGQYAHGNEPSHHLIYAYLEPKINLAYKDDIEIRKKILKVINEFYKNSPNGLIGNEDCGQMSAWYVMSAMGFYQLCPGRDEFVLGISNFEKIKIKLQDSSNFLIDNKTEYSQSYWNKCINSRIGILYFNYKDMRNATLMHECSIKPHLPLTIKPSIEKEFRNFFPIAPFFNNPSKNFTDSFEVEIERINVSSNYFPTYFSIDNGAYNRYEKPFTIHQSCKIKAFILNEFTNEASSIIESEFVKLPANRHIQLLSTYENLYNAGGAEALIDLQRGNENWRIGGWQGYAGKDFAAIVDVGSSKQLKSIGLGCLQDQGAWVMMPKEIIFEGSNDGKIFEEIKSIKTNVSDTIDHAIAKDYKVDFSNLKDLTNRPKPYRYYKVTAKNYGKLPSWHWSKGEPAWLFVDEILIEE
jgi:hypothetical protein